MKKLFFLLMLVLFSLTGIKAQWLQVTFCGATTKVEPPKDAQGNDQRHKGALMLKYIHVKTFGSRSRIIYDIGTTSSDLRLDEKVYLDDCFNNNVPSNCKNCGICIPPTSNNKPFGTIIAETEYTGGIRVRGKDGGLLIESTGYTNQVCYTTPGLDMHNYQKKPASLEVAFEGFEDGDFRSKGVEVSYSINKGPQKWLKRLNNTVGEHMFSLSKTDALIANAVIDLNPDVNLKLRSSIIRDEIELLHRMDHRTVLELSVMTMDARPVLRKKISVQPTEEMSSSFIQVPSLDSGSYVLLLKDDQGNTHSFQFIKT